MSEVDAPQRVEDQEHLCCCVLVFANDDEVECLGYTSGVDDPFCGACDGRHWDDIRVITHTVKVTARLRKKEEA